MKEKSVFDNFLGEHDNSILLNKLKIHDELKDTIINNNIIKIMNLEKAILEENKVKEEIKRINCELQMKLANKHMNKPLADNLNTSKKSSIINRSDLGSDNEMSITLVNDKKKDTKRSFNNHSVDEEAFSRKRGNNTPIRSSQRSSNENIYSSQKIKLIKSNDIKKNKISTSSFNTHKVITKKETPPASKITLKKVNTSSVSKTNVIQISKTNVNLVKRNNVDLKIINKNKLALSTKFEVKGKSYNETHVSQKGKTLSPYRSKNGNLK